MDRGAWWGHKRVRYDLETKTNNSTIFKNKGLLWYEEENLNEQECYFSNSRTFFFLARNGLGNQSSQCTSSIRQVPAMWVCLAQMFRESLSSFIRQISLMSYSFTQWMIIKPVQVLYYLDYKQSSLRRGHNIVGNYRRKRFDPWVGKIPWRMAIRKCELTAKVMEEREPVIASDSGMIG